MSTSDQPSTTPIDADPQATDQEPDRADNAPADDRAKRPATKTLTGPRRRAYILGGGFGGIIGG